MQCDVRNNPGKFNVNYILFVVYLKTISQLLRLCIRESDDAFENISGVYEGKLP